MAHDGTDEHVKTVYAQFGLAMYLAQVLEHGLVNALVVLDLLPSRVGKPVPRKEWEREFESFMERHFETTLGRMIRNLKTVTPVPTELETILSDALRRRNFLAHDYFRERAEKFMSIEGREDMLSELQEAQALFEEADAKLTDVSRPLREKFGLTDERLAEFFGDYLRKVRNDL
jgi:hypothetical protein